LFTIKQQQKNEKQILLNNIIQSLILSFDYQINEYEYFEIEDELEISEKKDLNVHRYLDSKNKENDIEQSL